MKTNYLIENVKGQKNYLLVLFCLLFVVAGMCTQKVNAQSGVNLYPTDDTYQRNSNGTTPFGNEVSLRLQFHTDGSWRREVWLKFKISDLDSENIQSATVILYPVDGNTEIAPTHYIRETATNWSESTLVSANKPAIIDVKLDEKVYVPGEPVQLDVTDTLIARVEEGKDTISFNIRPSGVAGALFFHSKESESTDLWPVLLIKDIPTGVEGINSSTNWSYIRNGIQITTPAAALVTLYDLTGSVVKTVQVKAQADIHVANPGMYIMRVQPANGKASVEKILIR